MKLETFFEKFDQFADASNAIPAMRELVLQLAVRGNLTERIGSESSKTQLAGAEAFRIRRAKREAPDAEDVPFPIPDNWGWVAVGDSMDMFNGRAFKPDEWSTEGTPIIRIQNLNNEHAAFNRCKADLDPKIHVHTGDFLISWSGTPGTSFGAFIWNRGFAYLNQHIFRCELVNGVFEKAFLRLAINARLDEMISHAHGAVGLRHITKGKLESIRLPLPPLAEQKRIVAKVDELMALCDRLEAQQQERETRHASLARASLARFADAPTPANLPFLFHPSYAILPADLRKSILTLAVQGKLVPQDPNDEPANLIVENIKREKARLVTQKVATKRKSIDPLVDSDLPFAAPQSWQWCRLEDLVWTVGDGPHHSPRYVPKAEGVPFLSTRNITAEGFRLTDIKYVSRLDHAEFCKKIKPTIGDVLYTKGGTTGIALVNDLGFEFSVWVHVSVLKVAQPHVFPRYVAMALNSPHCYDQSQRFTHGIGNKDLGLTRMVFITIPLPPLKEQHRIVAKVEQLMTLVDALETQLAASRATAANLLSALVAELTGTPSNGKISVPSASTTGRRGRPPKS